MMNEVNNNNFKKNNKNNNFKSRQQQIKRQHVQEQHIAQMPNKMKKAIEDYATPQKQSCQEMPNKSTKIKKDNKLFALTPKNIQSMLEDEDNGEFDGKTLSYEIRRNDVFEAHFAAYQLALNEPYGTVETAKLNEEFSDEEQFPDWAFNLTEDF